VASIRVLIAVVFTILPIALLLRFFFTRDLRREPRTTVAVTFILGIVIALPAIFVSLVMAAIPGRSFGLFGGAAYEAFAVAAIPEELLKLLVIACYCARRRSFDEPMDGLVYGATAALGFAAIENALYVAEGGWIVAVLRSVTAVPMHAAEGAILGHYVARSRLLFRRGATWAGLAIAVFVHGAYDFGPMVLARLGADEQALAGMGARALGFLVLMIVVVIVTLGGVYRLVWRLRAEQVYPSAPGVVDGPRLPSEERGPLVAHLLERRAQEGALPTPAEEHPAEGSEAPESDPPPPTP
jgi:hypothetical protein